MRNFRKLGAIKKHRGLGTEDIMHKQFASLVGSLELYNSLSCKFWTYFPSGENRNALTGSLLKSKGLKSGVADYMFIREGSTNTDHTLWLEMKAPEREAVSFDEKKGTIKNKKISAGKQSDSQVAFENLFFGSRNSYYAVVYSVDEGLAVLKSEGYIR